MDEDIDNLLLKLDLSLTRADLLERPLDVVDTLLKPFNEQLPDSSHSRQEAAAAVLCWMSESCSAKELLLALLEQADQFKTDDKFTVLLKPLSRCLYRLPVSLRCDSLAMTCETLVAHLTSLPHPHEVTECVLDLPDSTDTRSVRIVSVTEAFINFLEPFVIDIIKLKNSRSELSEETCSGVPLLGSCKAEAVSKANTTACNFVEDTSTTEHIQPTESHHVDCRPSDTANVGECMDVVHCTADVNTAEKVSSDGSTVCGLDISKVAKELSVIYLRALGSTLAYVDLRAIEQRVRDCRNGLPPVCTRLSAIKNYSSASSSAPPVISGCCASTGPASNPPSHHLCCRASSLTDGEPHLREPQSSLDAHQHDHGAPEPNHLAPKSTLEPSDIESSCARRLADLCALRVSELNSDIVRLIMSLMEKDKERIRCRDTVAEPMPYVGIGVFLYILYDSCDTQQSSPITPSLWLSVPAVYTPSYLFLSLVSHFSLRLLSFTDSSHLIYKGLLLAVHSLRRLSDSALSSTGFTDWSREVTMAMIGVMRSSKVKLLMRLSLTLFSDWLRALGGRGKRYTVEFLLAKVEWAGIHGHVITGVVKEELSRIIDSLISMSTYCNNDSINNSGSDVFIELSSLESLLRRVFVYEQSGGSAFMQQLDRTMSALNLLRYLTIRLLGALNTATTNAVEVGTSNVSSASYATAKTTVAINNDVTSGISTANVTTAPTTLLEVNANIATKNSTQALLELATLLCHCSHTYLSTIHTAWTSVHDEAISELKILQREISIAADTSDAEKTRTGKNSKAEMSESGFSVSVGEREMGEMRVEEKVEAVRSSLVSLDMMYSVLQRTEECLANLTVVTQQLQ